MLFGLIIFAFFSFIGIVGISVVGIPQRLQKDESFLLIAPMLGALICVCWGETLLLLLPVRFSAWIGIIIAVAICIIRRNTVAEILKAMLKMRWQLLIGALACAVAAYPVWRISGLVSPQSMNNDIAYYLSDMDWLTGHNFWQSPMSVATAEHPFYTLANYMLENTRIGTDVLGSEIMGLTFLQPHQVYFACGIAITAAVVWGCGFLAQAACGLKKNGTLILMVLLAFSFNFGQLQRMQYVPQIFGIGAMAVFMGVLLCMLNENVRELIFCLGLCLAGALSVYCEFSVHLASFFFLACIWTMLTKRDKDSVLRCWQTVKGCLLILVFSPLGTFKAIKFNLMLLDQLGTTASIDPFAGNMIPPSLLPSNFFGATFRQENMFGVFPVYFSIVLFVLIAAASITVLIVKHTPQNMLLALTLGFYLVYELFFRKSNFAYGEYKHFFSVIPIAWTILAVFLQEFLYLFKSKTLRYTFKAIYAFALLITLFSNVALTKALLSPSQYFYYDNSLMELRTAAEKLPPGEIIEVPGAYNDVHASIYALKNASVCALGDSYYSYFWSVEEQQQLSTHASYRLVWKDKASVDEKSAVWENEKYALVKTHR